MTKQDIVKTAYADMSKDWDKSISMAEIERNKAQAAADACESEMQAALRDNDLKRYMAAKVKQQNSIAIVDYHKAQLDRVAEEKSASIEGFRPIVKKVYADTLRDYKEACAECIAAINHLKDASDKAMAIVNDYDAAMDFFRNYIAHTQDVLGGIVPNNFPNRNACDLTKSLQFQLGEMQRFLDA